MLYGRDRYHLPVLSDLIREASSQLLVIRMLGTLSNPKFTPEVLPQVRQMGRPGAGGIRIEPNAR